MERSDQEKSDGRAGMFATLWPARILGPAPGLKEINLAAWAIVLAVLATRFLFPVWIQYKAGLISLPLQPNDFVYFYGIGHIAKDDPAASLYDFDVQMKAFNAVYSSPDHVYGPTPYPPFVGLFFSMFARLSFPAAFFLWAACSLMLYVGGIALAARDGWMGEGARLSLLVCFSLAFYPYFWGILVNGQISTIAVFSVGLAVFEERRSRPYRSGLALAILGYKPTLLLLIVPMLLLTRRWKTLSGLMSGGAVQALVSTAMGGLAIWPTYARFVALFGRAHGLEGHRTMHLFQYIDVASCMQAMEGVNPALGKAILAPVAGLILLALAVLLWKSTRSGAPAQALAWAATLTWTLLLNVYVPMYDAVLVAVTVALTLGAVKALAWDGALKGAIIGSLAIFAVSWISLPVAMKHGVQWLSIALALLGLFQLYLLFRASQAHAVLAGPAGGCETAPAKS